jgi:uncharacterized membrane protein YbhN (UPF0104 family)
MADAGDDASVAARRGYTRFVLPAVAVFVLLSLGAAGAAEWRRRPDIDWSFSPGWLLLAVLLLAAFQAGQAELWRIMLTALGSPMDGRRARSIWNLTLIARYIPTSALQAAGRVLLSERAGVPRRVGAASFVYELVLSFAVALALASAFIVTLPALAGLPWRWSALVIPVLLLIALHPRIFGALSGRVLRGLRSEPLARTLTAATLARLTLGYAACFTLAGLGLYALTQALYPVDAGRLVLVTAAFSVAYVASLVAFILPAGLGAREAALTATLAPVLPDAVALAVAVVLRLTQIAIEVLLVSLTYAIDRGTRDRQPALGEPPAAP